MKDYPKQIRYLVNFGLVAVILLVLYLFMLVFGNFITRFMQAATSIILPFSIALFISYLLAPLFKLLEKKLRFKHRMVNTILILSGVGVLMFFFISYAGNLIYQQTIIFIENDWPRVESAITQFLDRNEFLYNLFDGVIQTLSLENLAEYEIDIFGIFQSVTTIIITIVLVPVFLFFILNDRDRIYKGVVMVFPKKVRHHVIELLKRANRVIEQYFNGRFITMTIMAIAFMIMFWILGFKERSILFGFMLGFFDIVPYVGPFIAMILPVLYSLTDDTLMFGDFAPLVITAAVIVGQIIQNNVAQPLIMGKETKLHPLLVLSSFVFFGYLFGVVGIILAIPITGMIRTTFNYFKELNEDRLALDAKEKEKLNEEITDDNH